MTEQQKIGASFLIAIIAVVVPVVIWMIDRTPRLSYVQDSYRYSNGFTYITVANKPGTGTAIFTKLHYLITDESILSKVNRIDPKPSPPYKACASNNVDSVYFSDGRWDEKGNYFFTANVSYHIPPGQPDDLELGIVDPRWQGFRFVGYLIVPYNGDEDFCLDNVVITGCAPRPR